MRKGFTLIELLIVVTIIAILAGAAIPYVQDYIDQAKLSRVRMDLNEIRNGLSRWEIDRDSWQDTDVTIAKLLGPYLTKALVDPWGGPYVISNTKSLVYSKGQNGVDDLGINDDITLNFRPRMAVTRTEYLDVNGNGIIDTDDTLTFICTRPPQSDAAESELTNLTISSQVISTAIGAASSQAIGRKLVVTLSTTPAFGTGDFVNVGTTDTIKDWSAEASSEYAKNDVGSMRLLSAK